VLQPEGSVISGTAADVQEQRHIDAELLLKKCRDTGCRAQPTGADGPSQPLTRLIGEHRKQLVQTMLLQRLQRRDTTDVIKAEIQTAQAGAERFGQRADAAHQRHGPLAAG